jgi:urease accessory protein
MDTLCFGLPARNDTFASGRCRQRFEVWRGPRPLVLERGRFDAADPVHAASWGLGHSSVAGLMVIVPAPVGEEPLAQLRATAAAVGNGERAGATVVDDGGALVCRYLGSSAEGARTFFHSAWSIVRPAVIGRLAVPPRIWST